MTSFIKKLLFTRSKSLEIIESDDDDYSSSLEDSSDTFTDLSQWQSPDGKHRTIDFTKNSFIEKIPSNYTWRTIWTRKSDTSKSKSYEYMIDCQWKSIWSRT